jgi:hypothetical protein|tara:strand:+ start:1909 stop:2148 length:240 start_codon:yes stop_codon:yes gene_type:complete
MDSLKLLVRKNRLQFAIVLFLIIFTFIHIQKPSLLYENDGSFRQFGVGYRKKTVVPIWLISIVVALLSYVMVSFYLAKT